MKRQRTWGILAVAAVAAAWGGPAAQAAVIMGNGTLDDKPVSVSADFTLDPLADSIKIVVHNLIADPTSVIQNLSSLQFTLNGSLGPATLVSSSGLQRTVNSNKTYTDSGLVDTGWDMDMSGSSILLNVLGTDVGPEHLIIGDHGAGNKYNNANGSIKGNAPHNPFLFGPVEFNLSLPGLASGNYLTQVVFGFGTSAGNLVTVNVPPPDDNNTNSNPVPEPATLALLGTGALPLLGVIRRRRRSA